VSARRGFRNEWMHDFLVGRYCVRVWHRERWRPFFSRRYVVVAFGAGPIGVQVMHTMTHEQFLAVTRNAGDIAS